MGWQLNDRNRMHTRLGPAFVIVSPSKTEVVVSDPRACEEVLNKYKLWTKSADLYQIFDVFGKNLNSVNGKDWQRHRKITTAAFREGTFEIVWDESLFQARTMSRRWAEGKEELTLKSLWLDICRLSSDVLMVAGFGEEVEHDSDIEPGEKAREKASAGHVMSYGESLRVILQNIVTTILFSGVKAPMWIMPKWLRELTVAIKDFRQYMTEKILKDKQNRETGQASKDYLMDALLQANEAGKSEEGGRMYLSDDELYGNMFVFNLAGFETTATAISYTMPLLACNPDIQEWVAEEVLEVFAGEESKEGIGYREVYPRLIRVMALMVSQTSHVTMDSAPRHFADEVMKYENLRLWGAVQGLPRYTGSETQMLDIAGNSYSIPPHTHVTLNFNAAHCDSGVWGSDAMDFRPSRWITHDAGGHETLSAPPDGAGFMPWSWGPRVCPGKKFSQVEYVAAVGMIVSKYRVQPARRGEESVMQATQRLLETMQDSYFNLSPKIRRPDDAGMVLVSRS